LAVVAGGVAVANDSGLDDAMASVDWTVAGDSGVGDGMASVG
jgi:hypothetical protein